MLELRRRDTPVSGCFGKPAALDQLCGEAELSVRVAPDELLLLTESQRTPELVAKLRALDPAGLAVDLTSGYATWELRGDGRFEAFCRLSAIPLPAPPAVAQGLVAHVPARIINGTDALLVIVPSVVSHHLRERLLAACRDLQPVESQVAGESQVASRKSQVTSPRLGAQDSRLKTQDSTS